MNHARAMDLFLSFRFVRSVQYVFKPLTVFLQRPRLFTVTVTAHAPATMVASRRMKDVKSKVHEV
jgi:hypothetical protein